MKTPSLFDQQPQGNAAQDAAGSDTGMRVLSVGVFPPKLNRLPPPKEGLMAKIKGWLVRKPQPAPVAAPVQTEWPMDRITVVRNDLSDSDFEVVWADPTASDATKPATKKTQGAKANPFTHKKETVGAAQ